jgi:hypothetical protein
MLGEKNLNKFTKIGNSSAKPSIYCIRLKDFTLIIKKSIILNDSLS